MSEIIDFTQNKDGTYEEVYQGKGLAIAPDIPITYVPQEIHKLLIKTKEELQENFLKMGAFLKIIHDNSLYLELDSPTWQEYLDTPEIDLSRSQAYKLMAVYERWCEKWGYSPERIKKTSIEKLYIASSQANDDTHEEWLCKAETLSRADLKAETPGGKHQFQTILCPYCGKTFELNKSLIQ